jgi:DNA invertase Pin-like site-specific DNA recombinase
MKLDEYRRVSQVAGREGDGFQSPEQQAHGIANFARLHGHTINPNPPELDISGGRLRRPVLDKIIERIRNGESDGIIVNDLDRYSRDVLGANVLLLEIKEAGGTVLSANENIDVTTDDGMMMFNFRVSMAQNYLAKSRTKWAEAQRHAVEKGIYTENHVPAGYDKGEDRRLYLSADAPIIKQAWRMRIARESTRRIVHMLNDKLPLPDGRLWIDTTVERMFAKRIYRGELVRRGFCNPDACEPLLSEAEWQAAQIKTKTSPQTKHENLLTGIVRCASCRYAMSPAYAITKKAGKSHKIPVYRCRRVHASGRCPSPSSITRKSLEPYVENAFRSEMNGITLTAAQTNADIETATNHLATLEGELASFASDTTARAALGDAAYHAAMESRAQGVEAARDALRALSTSTASVNGVTNWDALSIDERRRILGGAIDAVFIKRGSGVDDRSLIVWAGDLEGDLPAGGGKRNGPISSYVW